MVHCLTVHLPLGALLISCAMCGTGPMRLARLNEAGHFKEIEVGPLKKLGGDTLEHIWLDSKVPSPSPNTSPNTSVCSPPMAHARVAESMREAAHA